MLSKKTFIHILDTLEKQHQKDDKLADFLMDGYLDGINPVPTFSQPLIDLTIKLFAEHFEGEKVWDKGFENWIDWYIYENDYGRKGMEVILNKKKYPIHNAEDFYTVLQKWLKIHKTP
jgi:hypothetical protein